MLSKNQLKIMFKMQNKMNKTINLNWFNEDWDYMRATALECAEAIEHHGWKWWKSKALDMPQFKMELIDIWHFYLSRYLQINKGNEDKALDNILFDIKNIKNNILFDNLEYNYETMNLLEKLDLLTGISCAKRIEIGLFFDICKEVNLSFDEIYEQYVQKNTLNLFRQANGYKLGTYKKIWNGKEDNLILISVAKKYNIDSIDYADQIWNELTEIYQKI